MIYTIMRTFMAYGLAVVLLVACGSPEETAGLLVGVTTSIIGWLAWAFITYWIGKTIFKGPQTEVTYGQMLRTLGFANSPGILRIFSFVPFVGGLIAFVATVWVLIAGIVAIRQALDFSTWRAIGTAFVGWLVYVLLIFLISSLFIDTGAFIQTPI